MKKIFLNFLIFLASFFLFILIFFPYTRVVNYIIYKFSQKEKIKINYSYLHSNFFNTKIKDLVINDFKIKSITVEHNLFKYPFSGLKIKGFSDFLVFNIDFKKKKFIVNGSIKLNFLKNFYKKNCEGELDFEGYINIPYYKGLISLSSAKIIVFDKKLGKISFKNIKGSIIIEKNKIIVKKISSNDLPLTIRGYININLKNIQNSRINLNGNVKIAGIDKKFRIKGSIKNPRIF